MTKEFVPYEESLALKELGFDEECFGHYSKELGLIIMVTLSNSVFYKDEGVLAPLYQQVFRWFRENHNLFILMQVGQHNKEHQTFYFNVIEYGVNKYKSLFRSETGKYTHEEAELECLRKLIEIVKENKDDNKTNS